VGLGSGGEAGNCRRNKAQRKENKTCSHSGCSAEGGWPALGVSVRAGLDF
jgi:hypothetical protein